MQVSRSSGQRVKGLTPYMLCDCTDLLCVECIGLLSVEFSTVNTGLCSPMFGNLCVC